MTIFINNFMNILLLDYEFVCELFYLLEENSYSKIQI